MRIFFCLAFLLVFVSVFSQEKKKMPSSLETMLTQSQNPSDTVKKAKVAPIELYRIISIDRDTTYIDTSLTIKKEYSHNYLRRDNFGLLPFPNDGQTYNTLQYQLTSFSPYPEMGFKAKHFNFIEANQIRYASVATPVTELYFKTTSERGQSSDVFFTLNTAPGLNFSIAYKGLRSEGKYLNQLASTGNFRFTMSYATKTKRYVSNGHFASSDILNSENGGITSASDFESGNPNFSNRQRFEVFLRNARTMLKGSRYFLDHYFRINPKQGSNNLYLTHQIRYETKYFEYLQPTVQSSVIVNGELVERFGPSFLNAGITDRTNFNTLYNKVGLVYENVRLGKFQFYLDDFRSNYYFDRILIVSTSKSVSNSMPQKINAFEAKYSYQKNKWNGHFLVSRSITNQSLSNLEAKLQYDYSDAIQLGFSYQNANKLPNNNYIFYQSSYLNYNWYNDEFKNEKINTLSANASTPWVNVEAAYGVLNDHLYFENVATDTQKEQGTQIAKPAQYDGTINCLTVKANKEFTFRKFSLDNTFLYQQVTQSRNILNLPTLVGRNTIYYSNYFFKKKALYLQTGFIFNYFTSYYANEYNPVIGEFFTQNDKKIGNFPNIDFFVNAKIQRMRIFFKAEHFNSSFTGNTFYASPSTPYRDFIIRFGILWNFFQ